MLKNNLSVFVNPVYTKMFFSALLCIAVLCGCAGETGDNHSPVSVSITSPSSMRVGETMTLQVNKKNTDDFVLSVSPSSGSDCVKKGNSAVTCTPTKAGTYAVTVAASVDEAVKQTVNLLVGLALAVPDFPRITQIAANGEYAMALMSDGSIWTWGVAPPGTWGEDTSDYREIPRRTVDDTDWARIAAGYDHIIALKKDGSLWTWGNDIFGQLDDGTGTNINKYNTPTRIGNDTDWIEISGGIYHNVALKKDGSLWAWGRNRFGQLGDGTFINRYTPTRIGTDTNWAQIAAGGLNTFALKTNGSLWAWGENSDGELGDGTKIDRNIPTRIGKDTDWMQISTKVGHTIALKYNGSLWTWGHNVAVSAQPHYDDTITFFITPTRIGTDDDWVQIAAGSSHNVMLKGDGSLWAWGNNLAGQLGDGTHISRNTPARIGSDANWVMVAANSYSTIALNNDGNLWTWGDRDDIPGPIAPGLNYK